jgi:hypothetical protein
MDSEEEKSEILCRNYSLNLLHVHPLEIRSLHQVWQNLILKGHLGRAPMAHTYNSSYSGGKRSGGLWFKASPDKQFARPHLEKNHHKEGLVEWLKV